MKERADSLGEALSPPRKQDSQPTHKMMRKGFYRGRGGRFFLKKASPAIT